MIQTDSQRSVNCMNIEHLYCKSIKDKADFGPNAIHNELYTKRCALTRVSQWYKTKVRKVWRTPKIEVSISHVIQMGEKIEIFKTQPTLSSSISLERESKMEHKNINGEVICPNPKLKTSKIAYLRKNGFLMF